jgi:hypothetical protein
VRGQEAAGGKNLAVAGWCDGDGEGLGLLGGVLSNEKAMHKNKRASVTYV